MDEQLKGGLNPTLDDERDFALGAVFELPELNTLPANFSLPKATVRDQTIINKNNDKCTEYAYGVVDELQEKVLTNPDFSFAGAKSISGNELAFGQDIRTAGLGHIKIGAIPQALVPKEINVEDPKYRYIANWPESFTNIAKQYRKGSLWLVTGQYDAFDNIRASIYKFKQPVVFGCVFGWFKYQTYMDEPSTTGFGHAMAIVGWETRNGQIYLKIQQSLGERAGEQGYQFFSRKVINHAFEIYKAFMPVDMTVEEAKHMLDNGIKEDDGWLKTLLKSFISFLNDAIAFKKIATPTQMDIDNYADKFELHQEVVDLLKETKPMNKLNVFAEAIKDHEGWYAGSRSYRQNNPGNLRYSPYQIGTSGGYSVFKDYDMGWQALIHQLTIVCKGTSKAYSGRAKELGLTDSSELTIAQFFAIYAPSVDNNNPDAYALSVAQNIGVSITTKMKEIV